MDTEAPAGAKSQTVVDYTGKGRCLLADSLRRKSERMKQPHIVGVGIVCFFFGALVQAGLAQAKKPSFSPGLLKEKAANEAATVLLDGALQLADTGSWERIAVGRAWYLGGDKTKGQQIFDAVTGNRKWRTAIGSVSAASMLRQENGTRPGRRSIGHLRSMRVTTLE